MITITIPKWFCILLLIAVYSYTISYIIILIIRIISYVLKKKLEKFEEKLRSRGVE